LVNDIDVNVEHCAIEGHIFHFSGNFHKKIHHESDPAVELLHCPHRPVHDSDPSSIPGVRNGEDHNTHSVVAGVNGVQRVQVRLNHLSDELLNPDLVVELNVQQQKK
jgi:hypothetical protein